MTATSPTAIQNFKNGTKSTRKDLKSVFIPQLTLVLSYEKYLELKMSVQSVQMDPESPQFTIVGLRTRGSGPLSSSKKTKAKKQQVQGMEFSMYPSNSLFESASRAPPKLQSRLGHRKPYGVHSVTLFCYFKSVLKPSTDISPLIPIHIIVYVQSQNSTVNAMLPDATWAPVPYGLTDSTIFLLFISLVDSM